LKVVLSKKAAPYPLWKAGFGEVTASLLRLQPPLGKCQASEKCNARRLHRASCTSRIYLMVGKGGMFWLDWLYRIFAGLFWMPILLKV
jgi:hypothetical protein